jgi:malonyl-CoA decarboxylase
MKKRVRQVAELARRISSGDGADRNLLERFRRRCDELSADDRLQLYRWLAAEFEVGRAQIEDPISGVRAASEDDRITWNERVRELRKAIASPRQRVFANLITTTGGLEFVLELRAEVLEAQRQGEDGLEPLEEDIAHLLNRWCQHGLLFVEEIDLGSPYKTIRFLKEREMVHPMVSLEEMVQRLGEDRMCFALHHVVMPEEPVVFIEVALSRGLLRSIHDVIDDPQGERAPISSPDTAIFYSINNTQNGLAGLGLGKVLILRVTEALRERHPSLTTFATLSPIPGFWPRYLKPILEGDDQRFGLSRSEVVDRIPDKAQQSLANRNRELGGEANDIAVVLQEVLTRPDWVDDQVFRRHLKKWLTEIAYFYISEETDARGKPLNPVAGFHLGNGATVSRANINFAANTSPRGLEESCGLMVNYVYSQKALTPIGRAFRALLPWSRRNRSERF